MDGGLLYGNGGAGAPEPLGRRAAGAATRGCGVPAATEATAAAAAAARAAAATRELSVTTPSSLATAADTAARAAPVAKAERLSAG